MASFWWLQARFMRWPVTHNDSAWWSKRNTLPILRYMCKLQDIVNERMHSMDVHPKAMIQEIIGFFTNRNLSCRDNMDMKQAEQTGHKHKQCEMPRNIARTHRRIIQEITVFFINRNLSRCDSTDSKDIYRCLTPKWRVFWMTWMPEMQTSATTPNMTTHIQKELQDVRAMRLCLATAISPKLDMRMLQSNSMPRECMRLMTKEPQLGIDMHIKPRNTEQARHDMRIFIFEHMVNNHRTIDSCRTRDLDSRSKLDLEDRQLRSLSVPLRTTTTNATICGGIPRHIQDNSTSCEGLHHYRIPSLHWEQDPNIYFKMIRIFVFYREISGAGRQLIAHQRKS